MADNARRTAIMDTYQGLMPDEKKVVDRIADRLACAIKDKAPEVQFGRLTAIEVLGALGVLLASEGEGPSAS